MDIQWPFLLLANLNGFHYYSPSLYYLVLHTYICTNTDIRKCHWCGIWTWWWQETIYCLPFFYLFTWSLSVTERISLFVPKKELSECSSSFLILLCWFQASRSCLKVSGLASYTCLFPERVPSFFSYISFIFFLMPICSIKILLSVPYHQQIPLLNGLNSVIIWASL